MLPLSLCAAVLSIRNLSVVMMILWFLAITVSCRSWSARPTDEAVDSTSQLKALYDEKHYFALAYHEESRAWRFEVCRVNQANNPIGHSCVNAFQTPRGPLLFSLEYFSENDIDPEILAQLRDQQALILESKEILAKQALLGGSGIALLAVGLMQLGKVTSASAPLLGNVKGVLAMGASVLLTSAGGLILKFRADEREEGKRLEEQHEGAGPHLHIKPERWLVVFNNWSVITSTDPDESLRPHDGESVMNLVQIVGGFLNVELGFNRYANTIVDLICEPGAEENSQPQCHPIDEIRR